MSRVFFGEKGYLDLLDSIVYSGHDVPDRTGVGSRALFDAKIVWLEDEFPFFTHRPVYQRPAFEEFWFMLNGKTQTKELEKKGVNFWKGNTSREFLDARGLENYKEGEMGLAYGFQWRNFGGQRMALRDGSNHDFGGRDQLHDLLHGLQFDPYGRRHVISLWNPLQSSEMALTPCWWACQFVVLPENGKDVLHLKIINRSLDAPFGLVYAVQQYRMLQMALAKWFKMEVGRLACDLTQVHVYSDQVEWVKETLGRGYAQQHNNTIHLAKDCISWGDILNLKFGDWKINYTSFNSTPYETQKPEMAV